MKKNKISHKILIYRFKIEQPRWKERCQSVSEFFMVSEVKAREKLRDLKAAAEGACLTWRGSECHSFGAQVEKAPTRRVVKSASGMVRRSCRPQSMRVVEMEEIAQQPDCPTI
uniref:Uncharacterized protein n=2 Tax=Nothobranchius TaxID=28779 RepID=A0A1A8UGF4_NOTFU